CPTKVNPVGCSLLPSGPAYHGRPPHRTASPEASPMPRHARLSAATIAILLACAAPLKAADTADAPLFSRHVVPLLSRLGCNAGLCPGAVQGKGGFRLSLFGVEPALDHERLLRECGGRRVNLHDPDASLLLVKATGRTVHGGGKRLEPGGPEYQL